MFQQLYKLLDFFFALLLLSLVIVPLLLPLLLMDNNDPNNGINLPTHYPPTTEQDFSNNSDHDTLLI